MNLVSKKTGSIINTKTLVFLLFLYMFFTFNKAEAYEVWYGTPTAPPSMATKLGDWDIVASKIKGLNINTTAPHKKEGKPTNSEWTKIFKQFTGVESSFVPWPRSWTKGTINETVDFIIKRELKRGVTVKGLMLYNARSRGVVYNWTVQEAKDLRAYLDSTGRSDIIFYWDARGYNADMGWNRQSIIDDIVIEGGVDKWTPVAKNGRDRMLRELWTDPALKHKRIILQIPQTAGYPTFYHGVRRLMRWFGEEMGYEFMRSDRVVFQICNYASYATIPETNKDGTQYANTMMGTCLMLIEQKAFFEGRLAKKPTKADDGDMTRFGVLSPEKIDKAPVVSIAKPANNSTFQLGTVISIKANAQDDSKVTKVVFKINGKDFSTDKKSPYSLTWTPKKVGKYKIEAEAYDDGKNQTISNSITVEVINNSANEPTIEMVEAEEAPNVASNLLDGFIDDDHRWSAEGYPKSVVIDYGKQKTITGTNVCTFNSRSYKYTVSVSNSPDKGFVEVVNQKGVAKAQPIAHRFSAVKGRYVKLTVTGANNYSNNWVSINEFEIIEAELTPQSYTKNPTDDIYTENGSVNNTKELRVENDTRRRISYLKFDLSDVNGVISEAKLKLKETANEAGNGTIKVYIGSNSDWDERNTGTLPKKGKEVGNYKGNISKNEEFKIDLTGLEAGKNVTLIVEIKKGGNDISFVSSEGENKPKLQFSTLKRGILNKDIENEVSVCIYPNPTDDILNIDFNGCDTERTEVKVMTLEGRILSITQTDEAKVQLNVSELSRGIYLVEVRSGGKISTKRFYKR